MWTPKRILLLLGGFGLFLVTFFIYAYFLGGIDGLPPLPIGFLADPTKDDQRLTQPKLPPADEKLLIAFGEGKPEIQRSIRVELRSRGLVVATDQFNIMPNDKHRVQLIPFSAAIFGKPREEGAFPEINTIKGDEAFLIFDRPIEHMNEIGDRKIIGAELHGKMIVLNNNRRTPQKSDDIEVHIVQAPLIYSEAESRIYSDGWVELTDTQSKGEPTKITGLGLEIFLNKDNSATVAKPAKAGPPAKKAPAKSVTGVEKLTLKSAVDMHFHVDGRSGFLGPNVAKNEEPAAIKKPSLIPEGLLPPPAPKPLPKPSHVNVQTQGPFTYDVDKDLAVFQSPKPGPAAVKGPLAKFPSDSVKVRRIHSQEGEGEKWDQLDCDRLELQFRKKKDSGPKTGDQDQGGDREIETAHATARPNEANGVTVILSAENLHAHCDELIYHCPTEERGPETILRGKPMSAVKDLHKIVAQEVQLIGADKKGEGQYARAKGPGWLHLIDDHSKIQEPLYHATWKDTLVVTKDKEKNRVYDLLTFKGEAGFIDDSLKQELHADTLMVWLEQAERLEADQLDAKKDKAAPAPHQQPHRLEGFEKVWVQSPDLNIHDSDYLIINFKNEAETRIPGELPALADGPEGKGGPAAGKGGDVTITYSTPEGIGSSPSLPKSGAPAPTFLVGGKQPTDPFSPGADKDKKPHKPIELTAKRVRAEVLRTGSLSQLKEVFTEGNVHVTQEAVNPKEKGVDITGDLLKLYHNAADGDILIVFGDPNEPTKYARLELGDLVLVGPEVKINQVDNTATVEGPGAMQLPSSANLDGTKNSKPGVILTVFWKDSMYFNGQDAMFTGNVNATQEGSQLLGQNLHVYLDKMVSLKEGDKKGQGAKVERLVSSGKVTVQDVKKDEKGAFARFDRLVSTTLTMDNQEDQTNAQGPGQLDSLQYGTVDSDDKNAKNTQKQLYLTRVIFQGRLSSKGEKDKTRTAWFYDNVEVYHCPSISANLALTPEKMPKGGMYLRSNKLTVFSKPRPDGKTAQEMFAENNVFFQHDDVKGKAPIMRYNQETEVVILEGKDGVMAEIYKYRGPGVPPDVLTGKSIVYNRKTGLFNIGGSNLLQGSSN